MQRCMHRRRALHPLRPLPCLEELFCIRILPNCFVEKYLRALLAPCQLLGLLGLERRPPIHTRASCSPPRILDQRCAQLVGQTVIEEAADVLCALMLPLPPIAQHSRRPLEVAIAHLLRHAWMGLGRARDQGGMGSVWDGISVGWDQYGKGMDWI